MGLAVVGQDPHVSVLGQDERPPPVVLAPHRDVEELALVAQRHFARVDLVLAHPVVRGTVKRGLAGLRNSVGIDGGQPDPVGTPGREQ
jgi:hypothetical protein